MIVKDIMKKIDPETISFEIAQKMFTHIMETCVFSEGTNKT